MNPEADNLLETELRQLKPLPVDQEVSRKIEEALMQGGTGRRRVPFQAILVWGGGALAASLLLFLGMRVFQEEKPLSITASNSPVPAEGPVEAPVSPPFEFDGFKPILAENNLTGRVDEGIVLLDDGLAARRYRYEFLDRIVWHNPVDGAVMELEIPRDEIILVPVHAL